MTQAPLKPCKHPGCPGLTRDRDGYGYCDKCKDYGQQQKRQAQRRYDRNRKSFRQRGYKTQWDKVRALKVRQDPLCEDCLKQDRATPVQVVHHIIPVSERPDLLLAMDNLKCLCRSCHEKTHARMNNGR